MTLISSKIMIRRSTATVWEVISDFAKADQYRIDVVNCITTGQGVGAQRTLTSIDGSAIVERLETFDAAAQRLSYLLLTDTPFGNCITTMALRDLGLDQAELTWSASFHPVGIPPNEAAELQQAALVANCQALKQFIEL